MRLRRANPRACAPVAAGPAGCVCLRAPMTYPPAPRRARARPPSFSLSPPFLSLSSFSLSPLSSYLPAKGEEDVQQRDGRVHGVARQVERPRLRAR